MKFLLAALLSLASVSAADTLSVFGRNWTVPVKADWEIKNESGGEVLHMAQSRGPLPGPRRPIQFALLDMPPARDVTVELDIRPLQKSCIIVFAYQDPDHFDYAHLSIDTAAKQPRHNGVFHVYQGERVRISSPEGPAAFPETGHWYHVVLKFSGESGEVKVSVEGKEIPALHAFDTSLNQGRIGLGSFDETGDFRNVRVTASGS